MTDGASPALIHAETFIDSNYAAGSSIFGLYAGGGGGNTTGVIDNLRIETVSAVR